MTRHRISASLRRLGVAIAAVATLGVSAPDVARAESLSGLFLAARHAEASNDFENAGHFYRRILAYAPDRAELMSAALTYSLLSGRTARALHAAERLMEQTDGDRVALLTLLADDFRHGRYLDARDLLESRAPGSLTELLGALLEAWSAEGAADHAAADAALEKLNGEALSEWFGKYHAGLMLSTRGEWDSAASSFESALASGARMSPRMALAYGVALERGGRGGDAEKIYRDVLEADPNDVSMIHALARLQRGETAPLLAATAADGAAESFHGLASAISGQENGGKRFGLMYTQLALHTQPDFPVAQLLAGSLLDDLDQHQAAALMFDGVDPNSATYAIAQLGRAQALRELKRIDEALEALESIAASDDASPNVFFTIGDLLSREERFGECVDAYTSGIERSGRSTARDWVILFSRGICLERTGEWARAEADFVQALEFEPNQPDVLNYLGYSLVERGERFAEAREMIQRAVDARPDSGYIVDSLGWVLYRLGRFEEAVVELERAVELTPVEPVINDHFGDALWMVGRRLEARFQWRRALSFDPDDEDRERIVRKLRIGLDEVLDAEERAKKEALLAPANDAPSDEDGAAPHELRNGSVTEPQGG